VDDALLVRRLHRPGQRLDQPGRRPRRQRRAAQLAVEAAALDQLQREVGQPLVLADLVDLHDVRVLQAGHRLGLAAEAG
jgi:hypothetical protein